jgi:acetyltransferase-like isoleucine patch superfamily enzyme
MFSFIEFIKSDFRLIKMRRTHFCATLYQNVVVDDASTIGENVVLFQNVNLSSCNVGRFTYIQASSHCYNAEIGPFCSIASEVSIGLLSHPLEYVSTSPVFYDSSQPLPKFLTGQHINSTHYLRTIIGPDVWIGHGVKIMAGIEIGVGAVIAAGAVVTKNVAPYEIVGGVPAKTIRYRLEKDVITDLQQSEWWELPEEKLKILAPLFFSPEKFVEYLKKQD